MKDEAEKIQKKQKEESIIKSRSSPPGNLSQRAKSQWSRMAAIGILISKKKTIEKKISKKSTRNEKLVLEEVEKKNEELKKSIKFLKQQEVLKTIQQKKNDIMRHINNKNLFDPNLNLNNRSKLEIKKPRVLPNKNQYDLELFKKPLVSLGLRSKSLRKFDPTGLNFNDYNILDAMEKRTEKKQTEFKLNQLHNLDFLFEKKQEDSSGLTDFQTRVKRIKGESTKVFV